MPRDPIKDLIRMKKAASTKTRREKRHQGPIRTVRHTVDVLRRISEAQVPLGINELARRVGLDKSSVSRLVATLESEYLVRRETGTGRVSLGLGLVALAAPATAGLGIKEAVRPLLAELAQEAGETSSFSVWDGSQAVSIEQVSGAGAVRIFSEPGRRDHGHSSAAGKMLLAHAGDKAIAAYCAKRLRRLTARTITDPAKLSGELELILYARLRDQPRRSRNRCGCRLLGRPRSERTCRRNGHRDRADLSFRPRTAKSTYRAHAAGRDKAWTVAAFRLALSVRATPAYLRASLHSLSTNCETRFALSFIFWGNRSLGRRDFCLPDAGGRLQSMTTACLFA